MTQSRRRGRPRSADADTAILTTTLELLAEEGLRGLGVERVAARAGVAKTTIYRRYRSKSDLAAAALELLAHAGTGDPDTGSAREDVLVLTRQRIAAAPSTKWNLLMPRLVVESASDPELYALVRRIAVDPIRQLVARILERGIERGELPPELDVELATDVLLGPLVYRLLINRGELAPIAGLPEQLFDLVARAR